MPHQTSLRSLHWLSQNSFIVKYISYTNKLHSGIHQLYLRGVDDNAVAEVGDVRDALVVDDDSVLDALHVVDGVLLAPLVLTVISVVFLSHASGDDGQGLVEIIHNGVVDLVFLGTILCRVVVLQINK